MFKAAFLLLALTILAAVFGLGGFGGRDAVTAKLAFLVLLLLAVVTLLRNRRSLPAS